VARFEGSFPNSSRYHLDNPSLPPLYLTYRNSEIVEGRVHAGATHSEPEVVEARRQTPRGMPPSRPGSTIHLDADAERTLSNQAAVASNSCRRLPVISEQGIEHLPTISNMFYACRVGSPCLLTRRGQLPTRVVPRATNGQNEFSPPRYCSGRAVCFCVHMIETNLNRRDNNDWR
jgi:hypothetical protein